MSELDKLEQYLKENGYRYARIDKEVDENNLDRHQIIVYDENRKRLWDAICHRGSYGYERGLLEIMGDIVDKERVGDSVEGWLTAEDVISKLKDEASQELDRIGQADAPQTDIPSRDELGDCNICRFAGCSECDDCINGSKWVRETEIDDLD